MVSKTSYSPSAQMAWNRKSLDSLTWTQFALILILLSLILRSLKRKYFNGLFHVPGPFAASFSRGWRMAQVIRGQLVRTGPNEVVVSDPKAMDTIYGFSSNFEKTDFYRIWGFPDVHGVHVFSQIDRQLHAKVSRHVASAYSMSAIVELEPLVDTCIEILMGKIDEHMNDEQPMNMAKWFQWYAFDVIGQLTFSTRFGFMETETDVEDSISQIDAFAYYGAMVGQAFGYHWLLLGNPLLPFLVNNPAASGIIWNIASKQIKAREGHDSPHRDMLFRFLKEHERKPDSFTLKEVHIHCAMNIAAGSDTTGATLIAILFNILKNPSVLSKLSTEIEGFERAGKLSTPVKLAETQTMPYLQAAMKEGMRIHPSVAAVYPRYVPQGGATVAGKYLPGGTVIGMNPFTIHRDKEIFGPDADSYRPERWLEDEANAKRMDRYMFQFGAGPYTCIGRHISILEMNKVIVELIRNYDIRLPDPKMELNWTSRWFFKAENLPCRFTKKVKA